MTDFKVGDKVEILTSFWNGLEATVTEVGRVSRGGVWDIEAKLEGGGEGIFHAHELKLLKPEPKFKVGDWVKVHGRKDEWDGTVGTILEVKEKTFGRYGHLYTILRNNKAVGEDHTLRFFEGALEATEAPKPEFSVGDKVRQKTGVNGHSLLDVLTVESLHPDMHHSVFVTNGKGSVLAYQPCELEKVTFASGGVIKQDFGKLYSYAEFDAKRTAKVLGKFNDPVHSPSHYTQYPVEVIELTRHMSFNRGNAVKYVARAGFKDKATEKQDIQKAIWYLQDELKELERKEEAK